MPQVSVIIPAYNAMKYIVETFSSVANQSLNDIEIIIVNDGSSDHITSWAATITDSRVRLINQSNQGLSCARNTGIRLSKAEYVAFLDADDIWEPMKLEKQLAVIQSSPQIGLVSCWLSEIDEYGNKIGEREYPNIRDDESIKELYIYNFIHCGSTPLIKRSCFEQVGYFDETLKSIEDWDMWLRIASYYDIHVIQEKLVRYRLHSSNMSKNWLVMFQQTEQVMKKAFLNPPQAALPLKGIGLSKLAEQYAWKSLAQAEYKNALWFIQRAAKHNFKLLFSKSFCHLLLLISLKSLLKDDFYTSLKKILRQQSI